eukprot:TRINITY_DN449_c0_g1_i3.p1 TRINITY_DN449_c0_g1~~TRINITY_DN449_c0_g1_i3.p1  ORF type:complete len:424 (+),score=63.75 TRINITY_DN449_c0_g1_i3:101-1372(+)
MDPSMICVFLISLIFNIDYGIIMPSLWLYLESLGATETWWLGLVLSIFSVMKMIASPLIGFWIDRRSIKAALLVGLTLGFIGNIGYSLALTPWMILVSRAICGLGSTTGVCCIAYVTRTTTEEQRLAGIAKIISVGQIGLLIGPALNFGIEHFNIKLFHFSITEYNAPGYLIATLLFFAFFAVLFAFKDPPLATVSSSDEKLTPMEKYRQFIGWATFTACMISFARVFNQTTLETIVTPLSREFYDWNPLRNSSFFAGLVVLSIIILISIRVFAKNVMERTLIMIGHFIAGLGINLYLVMFLISEEHLPEAAFISLGLIIISSLPFFMVSTSSLMSKLVPRNLTGFAQGMLSSMFSLGAILGPLWGGIALAISNRLLMAVLFIMWMLLSLLICYTFNSLVPRVQVVQEEQISLIDEEEGVINA